jgi:hypothetical protein
MSGYSVAGAHTIGWLLLLTAGGEVLGACQGQLSELTKRKIRKQVLKN